MAPCNQELKRRYALLNNASQSEGRLNLRKGGFPRRERPWAGVIDKRAAAGPLVRQPRRRKNDRLGRFIPASVSAQAKEVSAGLRSEPAVCLRGHRGARTFDARSFVPAARAFFLLHSPHKYGIIRGTLVHPDGFGGARALLSFYHEIPAELCAGVRDRIGGCRRSLLPRPRRSPHPGSTLI